MKFVLGRKQEDRKTVCGKETFDYFYTRKILFQLFFLDFCIRFFNFFAS